MSKLIQNRFARNDVVEDTIEGLIKYHLYNTHTAQPAHVYNFRPDICAVDIVLGVQRDLRGSNQDVSIITAVPICYPSSSNFRFTFPLERGDTGLAVFCESSLDRWLDVEEGEKEIVNPRDARMHDYTDAIFIPGIKRFNFVDNPVDDENVCIEYGDVKITLTEDGKFCIDTALGSFTDTLTSALNQLANAPGAQGAIPFIQLLEQMICGDSLI